MISDNAVLYCWRQLASRAGVIEETITTGTGFESLNLPVFYTHPSQVTSTTPAIIIVPASSQALQSLSERSPKSLDWLAAENIVPPGVTLPFDTPIPVLLWGEGCAKHVFAEVQSNGSLVINVDILAATWLMLTRWEEMHYADPDKHGRFPATASLAYHYGFLDLPIIDYYGIILQSWLRLLRPNWQPLQSRFKFQLSHDVDRPLLWSARAALSVALAKTRRSRSPLTPLNTLREVYQTRRNVDNDQYLWGMRYLMQLSENHHLQSAFYFMAAVPSRRDEGYDPRKKPFRDLVQEVAARGHEIGFHPGYGTFDDLTRFIDEKKRLEEAIALTKHPISIHGGRQHFLRFNVPVTWRVWESAGMVYDSTLGYADHIGFRAGTCRRFHPFDIQQDQELHLWERPLIVMDSTPGQYMKLSPDEAERQIILLARRCHEVGGEFTLLWHNSSLRDEWELWQGVYERVVKAVASFANH